MTSPCPAISHGQVLGERNLYALQPGSAAAFNQPAPMHARQRPSLQSLQSFVQDCTSLNHLSNALFDDYPMIVHRLCSVAALFGPGHRCAQTPTSSKPSASFRGCHLLESAAAQTWQHVAASCNRLQQVDLYDSRLVDEVALRVLSLGVGYFSTIPLMPAS